MTVSLVTGAAGFLGGHLCAALRRHGDTVRAVDYMRPRYGDVECDQSWWGCDLRNTEDALQAVAGVDRVYALAADMGGMGYIATEGFAILMNNIAINRNTVAAIVANGGVSRVFFASSACVYPVRLQSGASGALSEYHAWGGKPDTAYGVEKLAAETMYSTLADVCDAKVAIARFHNVYGPRGAWRGGREKAPAALCRKVAIAKALGLPAIKIWGTGQQVRSFCFISDAIRMTTSLTDLAPSIDQPLNIGSDRAVIVNELAYKIMRIAGYDCEIEHELDVKTTGVAYRNADMARALYYGISPVVSLRVGMRETYNWVEAQVLARAREMGLANDADESEIERAFS